MRIPGLAALARRLRSSSSPAAPPVEPVQPPLVRFRCNLCERSNDVDPVSLERESASCAGCGSTVRFRSMAQLVVRELLGRDATLPSLAPQPQLRGIGISDAGHYAHPFAQKFSYANTFFHQEPFLDVTDVPDALAGIHHFVTCSDVLEHVIPPVSRAFAGLRRLLRDDGVLVFTVPFALEGDTREHYPDLHLYHVDRSGPAPVVVNKTADGVEQRFADPVFHGGDGATLEMREFTRSSVECELRAAGFSRVRFADEPVPHFGIAWLVPFGVPVVARP